MSKATEYQKLTQREHVLKRPGMYIGQTKRITEEMWIYTGNKMQKKAVEYSPGFVKIFDEILTNAIDHSFKHKVTQIKVTLEGDSISVWNNGPGIPVEIHPEHNIYIPELIFGNMLSGSNYDDTKIRISAGLNGVGATCTNIFSKKFTVETADGKNNFSQEYRDNMTKVSKPKIKKSTKNYTQITYVPDYEKFGSSGIDADTRLVLTKRIYDCIACTSEDVKFYLNGDLLKGKGLKDYCSLYFDETPIIESHKDKYIWEYAFLPSSSFEQVSFVNGINTTQGGKHVDHIVNQIISKLKILIETRKKVKNLKPVNIKDKMFIFVRATVPNPTFSSQSKEYLTTPIKDFSSHCQVSDKYIEKIYKSSITDDILEMCKLKDLVALSKTTVRKTAKLVIPKLEDALSAGTRRSKECTLIITEGLSAMTFALHGRSILGNELFGVFPLKGKPLNVKDASNEQLIKNEELNNIKQILGLKHTEKQELRYGKLLILSDADVDGIHIKALVCNIFHTFWPGILKSDFIQTLRTPIVKANGIEFYTEQDYTKWKELHSKTKINAKYYKGLGSSTKDDARDIFKRFENLKMNYYYKDQKCDDAMTLAFSKSSDKTCSDLRKEWLKNYEKNKYISSKETNISYQDMINKELIHFSVYDNIRSIPCVCDGLKPSQRKILYYMLKKNICDSIKVAQLSGYVSAECGYHHGEVSLQGAIIGMAQNYTASNNINLLVPDGNFGTRYMCGKDAASPRYIFTKLNTMSKTIFNSYDSHTLSYLNDDNTPIEPEWYIPILPMVLVNGCEGVGTGYSTYVPKYNPRDIVKNILNMMKSKPLAEMTPWYKGFQGSIQKEDDHKYVCYGSYSKIGKKTIEITEIPIGMGIIPYKEFLESLIDKKIKDVRNESEDEIPKFIVEFKTEKELADTDIYKELKLTKNISTGNMHLFDKHGRLVKYDTPIDIMKDFYNVRLEHYTKRKEYIIDKLTKELIVMDDKIRFIKEYIDGILIINKQTKTYIENLLKMRKYHRQDKTYDYLLNMPIYSLTLEKIQELENRCKTKREELVFIEGKTEKDLWKLDLENISVN